MIKLTRILFARRLVREELHTDASSEVISVRRHKRRPLICVWIRDPETGRLVCSWVKPAEDDQCPAGDLAARPPPRRAA